MGKLSSYQEKKESINLINQKLPKAFLKKRTEDSKVKKRLNKFNIEELIQEEDPGHYYRTEKGLGKFDFFIPNKADCEDLFKLRSKYTARPKVPTFMRFAYFLKLLITETVSNVIEFDLRLGTINIIEKSRLTNPKLPIIVKDPFIRGYDRAQEISPENFELLREKMVRIYNDLLSGKSSSQIPRVVNEEGEKEEEEPLKEEED